MSEIDPFEKRTWLRSVFSVRRFALFRAVDKFSSFIQGLGEARRQGTDRALTHSVVNGDKRSRNLLEDAGENIFPS
jgi:hypothetical protein